MIAVRGVIKKSSVQNIVKGSQKRILLYLIGRKANTITSNKDGDNNKFIISYTLM